MKFMGRKEQPSVNSYLPETGVIAQENRMMIKLVYKKCILIYKRRIHFDLYFYKMDSFYLRQNEFLRNTFD